MISSVDYHRALWRDYQIQETCKNTGGEGYSLR